MVRNDLKKGEQTKKLIIDASYQLFLDKGYAATSMRDIASRAGLALGGIYNHFPGKEAIFSELIAVCHPYHSIIPILAHVRGSDPETFFRSAAHRMVLELGKNPDFIKLMMIEIVEFNGRNMPKVLEAEFPQILSVIQHFNAPNKALQDIPPMTIFRAFIGLFFSYYITELLLLNTPITEHQNQALDHFIEIFLNGVLSRKGAV